MLLLITDTDIVVAEMSAFTGRVVIVPSRCPLSATPAADCDRGVCHQDARATCRQLAVGTALYFSRGDWHQDASATCPPLSTTASNCDRAVCHRDVSATCCPLAAGTAPNYSRGVHCWDAGGPSPTISPASETRIGQLLADRLKSRPLFWWQWVLPVPCSYFF